MEDAELMAGLPFLSYWYWVLMGENPVTNRLQAYEQRLG